MSVKSFNQQCYDLLMKVPKGKVTTYKALAHALGTGAYRAVGNAMNKNPFSFSKSGGVPCHRVIKANGDLGGFATPLQEKIDLLISEGIEIKDNKINLKKFEHKF